MWMSCTDAYESWRRRRHHRRMRSASRLASILILAPLAAATIAVSPAGAQSAAPTGLKLSAGSGSLTASWGVSSTRGLAGCRVRWRPSGADAWSSSPRLSATRRSYEITGLQPESYDVKVRALLNPGFGGLVRGGGTPLAGWEEPPLEEPPVEEPPLEEPPLEEPPAEEPPLEEEEEPPVEEKPSKEQKERLASEITWIADPAAPILEDWASMQAEPGRITTIPDTSVPGGFAYADEIRNGDNPGGYGERSELGQGNPLRFGFENRLFHKGQDRWIAFPFVLGGSFPIDTQQWNVLMQVKQLGSLGTPIISMGSDEHGGIALLNSDTNGESSGNIVRWDGPLRTEQLNEVVLHIHFSPDPSVGFVELYGDFGGDGVKLLMGKTYMSTMKQVAGVAIDDHARIGQYRDKTAKSGTSTVYYGRYVVASSRAAAEAFAFE
jgi:hypothetical protein